MKKKYRLVGSVTIYRTLILETISLSARSLTCRSVADRWKRMQAKMKVKKDG